MDHLQKNINKKPLKFKLKTKGHVKAPRPEVRSLVTTGFRVKIPREFLVNSDVVPTSARRGHSPQCPSVRAWVSTISGGARSGSWSRVAVQRSSSCWRSPPAVQRVPLHDCRGGSKGQRHKSCSTAEGLMPRLPPTFSLLRVFLRGDYPRAHVPRLWTVCGSTQRSIPGIRLGLLPLFYDVV